MPSQAKPSQAKPSQAKPSQAKPSQAKPSQAKPSQAKPSQAKRRVRNVFSVAHADVFHALTRLIALPIVAIFCLALLFICLLPPSARAAQPLGLKQLIDQTIAGHPSFAAARAWSEVAAVRYQYYPSPSVQVLYDKGASTTILARIYTGLLARIRTFSPLCQPAGLSRWVEFAANKIHCRMVGQKKGEG